MRTLISALSLALLLLLAGLAAADNYTSRRSAAESESVPFPEVPGSTGEPTAPEPSLAPAETVPAAPAATLAAAPAAAPKLEKVWLNGKLPEGAQTEGEWTWSGVAAAGEPVAHSHPSANGMRSHRFTAEPPEEMPGNGMIVQQVWLDPQDPPQGIALRFTLASGEEVGVYWEGEKEVFTPTEYEELWYYGMLPELGKWVPLDILAEDLGFEDSRIAGIAFATFDGRALWGRTVITEAPPLEGDEEESQQLPAESPLIE